MPHKPLLLESIFRTLISMCRVPFSLRRRISLRLYKSNCSLQ